jgi:hypothetical protein
VARVIKSSPEYGMVCQAVFHADRYLHRLLEARKECVRPKTRTDAPTTGLALGFVTLEMFGCVFSDTVTRGNELGSFG